MTVTYFWDYSLWTFIIQMGIIAMAIAVGNVLRRKIGFIRRSLLPTAVIAGFLILAVKNIPICERFIDNTFMETLTYHSLGLGFIAVALKPSVSQKTGKAISSPKTITATGMITVSGYLVQCIVGLACTMLLAFTIMPDLFFASGILLPLGFGQGPGQAYSFGVIYETYGFESGASFGLAIAAIGFLCACIFGVVYMNILKKQGKLERLGKVEDTFSSQAQATSSPDEIPLAESVDKFTIQLAIVFGIYFATFLLIAIIDYLSVTYLGSFGEGTVRPLIWGLNFMFGTIVAVVVKKVFLKLRKDGVMSRTYPSEFLLNRFSGAMFDFMIVAGIAAIEISALKSLFVPLIIVCTLGLFVTFVYMRFICDRIYPQYNQEMFFVMFGMLTGTLSTGMILLREIDPQFKTPAATNAVLQSLPAIAFGFPIFLLVPYAASSVAAGLICLAAVTAMFIAFTVVLLKTKMRIRDEILDPEMMVSEA
ncbi:MAG: hypothetical protein R3Y32_04335 [Bacillota bacterium]